jgi:mRNA interferase RelE/StbE
MSTSTNYELQFLPSALKEWKKLDPSIRRQLKKKLAERLHQPHVPGSRLRGLVTKIQRIHDKPGDFHASK